MYGKKNQINRNLNPSQNYTVIVIRPLISEIQSKFISFNTIRSGSNIYIYIALSVGQQHIPGSQKNPKALNHDGGEATGQNSVTI